MGACASDPQTVDEEINAEFDGENEVDFEVGDVVDPMEQMNIDQSGGMMQYSNFQHGAVVDETAQQDVTSGDMYAENQIVSGVVGGGAVGSAQVYNPETDGQYFATLEEAKAAAGQSAQVDDMQYNAGAQQDAYLPQGVEYNQGFQQSAVYDQSAEMPVGQNMQYAAGYDQSAPVAMPTGQYDQYAQAENFQGQQGGMMMGQQGVMMMDNQMVVDPQAAQPFGAQMNMTEQQMPTDADGVAYEVDDVEAEAVVEDTQQESKKKKRRWW